MQIPPHPLILIQYVQQAKVIPNYKRNKIPDIIDYIYMGADKSLARPGRKQATATEDFDFHITYL
jgi:hypothetical protein